MDKLWENRVGNDISGQENQKQSLPAIGSFWFLDYKTKQQNNKNNNNKALIKKKF